jgi:ATP-dependent exoDNAse (exonuclease V) alpha subunit
MSEDEKQIKCTVKIASIRFYKNNWGILIVSLLDSINGNIVTDKYNCFAVKGVMPEPNYQDTYTIVAKEVEDPKWGLQYNLIYMGVLSDMSNDDSQKVFLSKILTSIQIENLYKTLKDPIAILENGDIQALTKVRGIGIRTAVALIERYKEHVDYSIAYVELDKYGLTPYAIRKIVDSYQSPEVAIQKIKDNPYILADEVEGIGWKKADSIALTTGIHPHAPQRVKAFITYFLEKSAEEGNSYISPSLLMDGIVESIGEEIDDDHLRKIIQDMKDELWWNEDKTKIGLKKYYDLEYNIANELLRILNGENKFRYDGWQEKIKTLEEKQGWDYTQQQIDGIKTVLENQLVVITGLGGCVDCDTEYFNGTQWKKISDFTDGEYVLQYNLDGTANLEKPIRYVKYPESTMYLMKTQTGGINQCLSLEHNIVYITSKGHIQKKPFYEMKEMHENNINGFSGKFITTFNYGQKGITLSEDEIRLMVAVIADGYFPNKTDNKCVINIKKQRKKDRLEDILSKNNITYEIYNNGAEGYHKYVFYPPRKEKEYTNYWYQCSNKQLKVIVDEMIHWDGSDKNNRKSFSSTSLMTANFIQFACSATGHRATLTEYDRTGQKYKQEKYKNYIRKSKEYEVHIAQNSKLITIMNENGSKKTPIIKTPTIDGYKYCFEIPSGMLILRRKGRIFITGNTGKSSVVGGMLKALNNYSFSQCALSGRAAARMTEVTGEQGKTIHRLLGYKPPNFTFNKSNHLLDDIIIVDEISMIGGYLFYQLLQAIKQGTKVVLIGDVGQLQSIGVLNVASDIIGSNVIPVVNLNKIHRQAQKSAIISDSINVRNGIQIYENGFTGNIIHGELQDLELDIYVNKAHTSKKIIEKFKENLSKVDSIFDIQVITPMKKRGDSCTFKLNQTLQDIYNPYNHNSIEIELSHSKDMKYKIRVGDKVMNTRNNYKTILKSNMDKENESEIEWYEDENEYKEELIEETPIFNGDMGIVKEISKYDIVIDFNRVGEIIVPKNHWKFIELSYACTCHKYQGSESKIIIIGLDSNSYLMLTKEWVYTAITRAKEYCILCAESKSLRYAISHNSITNKKTHLKFILKNFNDINHAEKIKEDRLLL